MGTQSAQLETDKMDDTAHGDPLAHTKRIEKMLQYGAREEAILTHNAHVEDQFARAERGEVICLSDLMAGHETLVLDAVKERQSQR